MPAPVRRTLLTAAPLALLALALAGVAMAAGNAGFAPEPGHSPNANRITDAYWVVFGFTAAIFLIVEGTLIAFIVKYRRGNRPRDAEGAEVHGHARLELIWTVIPVIILALIGTFVFYKLPGIKNTPPASAAGRQNIHVVGHQFYWQFTYPDGQVSINELHLPVGKVAYFNVDAEDVIHSFWVPQLGGKIDAIPGKTNHIWFQPDKIGTFHGRCAEMCGLYHAKMPILVVSESARELPELPEAGACTAWQGRVRRRLPDLPRDRRQGRLRPAARGQLAHAAGEGDRPDRSLRPGGDAAGRTRLERHADESTDAVLEAASEGGSEWRLGPRRCIRSRGTADVSRAG